MMQERKIELTDGPLYYKEYGIGPIVVLLHGFGEDSSIWKHQVNHLPGYRLLVPDLPGSGRSAMITDMSMEGMARAVQQLLVAKLAQGEKAVVVGHSMGGYITLALAEQYPHLLRGFGLFHSTAAADSEEKKEVRRKGIAFIQSHGGKAFLETTIPNLYSPHTKENKESLLKEHLSAAHNFLDAALVSYYVSMMNRKDRKDVLKNAAVPVLLILGRHDAAVPISDSWHQTHMADLSYIHILELSGHMGMVEEPQKSNEILAEYLNSLDNTLYKA